MFVQFEAAFKLWRFELNTLSGIMFFPIIAYSITNIGLILSVWQMTSALKAFSRISHIYSIGSVKRE